MYNFPVFKRSCNKDKTPDSVDFHQAFDSQVSANRKETNDLRIIWGPVFGIQIFRRKKVCDMPSRVELYIRERYLDLRFPNGAG